MKTSLQFFIHTVIILSLSRKKEFDIHTKRVLQVFALQKLFFSSVGPSGRPKFIRERLSTSSTSLSLVWAPPPQSSINAEFGGYELTYKPSNYIKANTSAIQINVRDSISIQVSICKNRCMYVSASIAFLKEIGIYGKCFHEKKRENLLLLRTRCILHVSLLSIFMCYF